MSARRGEQRWQVVCSPICAAYSHGGAAFAMTSYYCEPVVFRAWAKRVLAGGGPCRQVNRGGRDGGCGLKAGRSWRRPRRWIARGAWRSPIDRLNAQNMRNRKSPFGAARILHFGPGDRGEMGFPQLIVTQTCDRRYGQYRAQARNRDQGENCSCSCWSRTR